jgi:hypothetical protein
MMPSLPVAAAPFFALLVVFAPFVHGAPPLLEDNTAILNVPGRADVNEFGWADSYSDGDSCYCKSTFDHNIGVVIVDTPLGPMSVKEVCDLLGDGPNGSDNRPIYNDIQCGNGPANEAGDEGTCPGRTEYGQDGCKYIGPKWNFDPYMNPPGPAPTAAAVQQSPTQPAVSSPTTPSPPTTTTTTTAPLSLDLTQILSNVTGNPNVAAYWADSYSVGDSCYCMSTFDFGIGDVVVDVWGENKTVHEICDMLGPGPGASGRPIYNDIQCGNGPANAAGDESTCPGRTEYGQEGCNHIGPKWNLTAPIAAYQAGTLPKKV